MKMLYTWSAILVLCLTSTAGDTLISSAMKSIGDVQELRARRGLLHVMGRVMGCPTMWFGIGFMTVGFFSLLFALSWADVSVVGPASASLTFLCNAVAARVFLKERVDSRRWAAAIFVAAGVALLAA